MDLEQLFNHNFNTMVYSIKRSLAIAFVWSAQFLPAQETPLATLLGHGAAVNSIDLSPDGNYLVSGAKDETIRIWNLKTGQQESIIKTDGSSVKRVNFRPDGAKFLAALYGRFAEYDFKTLKARRSKKNTHSAFVETCIYSPNSKLILTSSWRDNTLVAWKASNFKKSIDLQESVWVDNAIFNTASTLVFSGGHDNLAKMWDLSTGSLVKSYAGHDDWIYDLCLSPDEKVLYTGSFDRTVKIWDVATGKNIGTLKGHKEGIVCIALSPDGRYLASAGMDKEIVIWDLSSKTEVKRFMAHEAAIMDLEFDAAGKKLYSCSIDKTIKIWNTEGLH